MAATSTTPRAALDRDISALMTELLRLGDAVDRAIDRSIAALAGHDQPLAREVIDADQSINRKRYKIEEDCLIVFATQQPAAGDLRRIIAAMHVAGELERMADHAAGIATIVLQLAATAGLPLVHDLQQMAEATRRMLRSALNAFVLDNLELAQRAYDMDDEIDAYHQQIVRTALTYMMEDRSLVNPLTYLLWVAHNLERIGDRCTNLSERTNLAHGKSRRSG
jgi:phosphate transport system protein